MVECFFGTEGENMGIRETVESVAREVIQSIKTEERRRNHPNILFVSSDSTLHESYRDEFIKLKNHDICYDILYLDGETSSWLGLQCVESYGSGKVIATDENAPAPIELPKKYDCIVVPEIDIDNAARIVNGLKGTVKAEIIFSALVLKKFVIIGEGLSGINCADRRCLNQLDLPPFYQKKFRQYNEEMKELGIELIQHSEIIDYTIHKLKSTTKVDEKKLPGQTAEHPYTFQGKLLTANWVQSQAEFPEQTIFIPNKTIVSPLAKDLIKEKGLVVQYPKNKG